MGEQNRAQLVKERMAGHCKKENNDWIGQHYYPNIQFKNLSFWRA